LSRRLAGILALLGFAILIVPGFFAPEFLPSGDMSLRLAPPSEMPPFGADRSGRPLSAYLTQGSKIVAIPSLFAGLIVMAFAVLGGLLACTDSKRLSVVIQGVGEVLGALPRLVVILVVARLVPRDQRSLVPIAVTWALLSAPGAMDEAASVAGRLGGARFVEALRAHGFSKTRVFLYHVVFLNLRPVVVRQALEVFAQVVFLEIALSYLTSAAYLESFTHPDSSHSWAEILFLGYQSLPPVGIESMHALALGMGLIGLVLASSAAAVWAVRAR